MADSVSSYSKALSDAFRTSLKGLKLTLRHFFVAVRQPRRGAETTFEQGYFDNRSGIETLRYPKEKIPVPDNGRYQLHNEIDDCILCDKCADICPVDCIDIESIRAVSQVGTASDGTPIRFHAKRFDIDMAKCFYCGLCTTVCPTECLTMTPEYNFSTQNLDDMIFRFAKLSEEEAAEKQREFDEYQEERKRKAAEKRAKAAKAKEQTGKEPAEKSLRKEPKTAADGKSPEELKAERKAAALKRRQEREEAKKKREEEARKKDS